MVEVIEVNEIIYNFSVEEVMDKLEIDKGKLKWVDFDPLKGIVSFTFKQGEEE